ncbi:MAG: tyrosine-type recombinase/integrase [Candidatus Binataceae bacterium]
MLHSTLDKVTHRVHLGIVDDSSVAFAAFADIWLDRISPTLRPRTIERWEGIVELHLKPAFPGALRSITAADAESYIARRKKPKACPACAVTKNANCTACRGTGEIPAAQPATVNREINVLKHIMRRAVAWEVVGRNPFIDAQGQVTSGLKPLREPSGRVRFLSSDEITALLAACERVPYLRAFAVVALNSGMRRNEIIGLTRKSIDGKNLIATLDSTKNGETRRVPLNSAAFAALSGLPTRLDGRPLFPFGPNQVSVAFQRAVRRAGIDDFRLHDLRHTFASYQAMAGVQGRGLQALLGHRDSRMTMRYSHLSDGYLHAAVDSVVLGAAPAPAARPAEAK